MINSDGLILSCSDFDQDISDFIYLMKTDFKIYLIGHSLLKKDSLNILRGKNINVQRIDVGKELLAYIIGTIITNEYSVYGSSKYKGEFICSGGYLGNEDSLIVDDFRDPKWYFASCDSEGGANYKFNDKLPNLKIVDNIFN